MRLFYGSQALNRLLSTESDDADNPEMVAGRLEIRVVSSPVPEKDIANNGTVNMSSTTERLNKGKSDLERKENELLASKVSNIKWMDEYSLINFLKKVSLKL